MTDPGLIKYSYVNVPTLERFARSNAFIRGCMGGLGSGKSSACVIELINRGLAQRPGPDGVRRTRFAVIRQTYGELRDTTIRTVMEWLPAHHFGRYIEHKHSYTITAFPNCEIEILFMALDRPEDVKKLLSLELTGAWINEAREMPWAVVEAVQGRVGRFPSARAGGCTWSGIWMDTNPPDADSSWYKFFEEKRWLKDFRRLKEEGIIPVAMREDDYVQFFKQPSGLATNAENLPNLPGGRLYYARLMAGKSDEWIKIYVHGDYGFIVEGKLVYPEYVDKAHCKAVEPIAGVPVIRGWDFGLTPACVFSQILPDGRWLVFDEMNSDNMGIDRFTDDVLEHCTRTFRGKATFEDWADPAGNQRVQTDERTCFDIMRAKGIMVEGAMTQDPTLRQESVRSVLRKPGPDFEPMFILHPRCKVLRKGFMGGYHRRRLKTSAERYSDTPEKNWASHCFPAGTAISTPTGARPIETLRAGDMVCTPLGPRRVDATMNRVAPTVDRIETAAARGVICTPDHPIWANGKFCRSDALGYGDALSVETSEPVQWDVQQSTGSKSSTASGTTSSHQATTKPAPATTCTVTSGDSTTDPSRPSSTSTTSMRTRRTTILETLRRFLHRNTRPTTAESGTPKTQSAASPTWIICGSSPLNGTDQTKVALGTGSTPSTSPPQCPSTPILASTVVTITKFDAGHVSADIARPRASRLSGGIRASMTSRAHAASAPHPSEQINIAASKHVDVFVGRLSAWQTDVRVYDLTVADAHCFYANGILVSNCHDALQYVGVQYFGPSLVDGPADSDDFVSREEYDGRTTRSEWTGY